MDLFAYQAEAQDETGALVVPDDEKGKMVIDHFYLNTPLELIPAEARILANALLEAARIL